MARMDTEVKLALLGAGAQHDLCGAEGRRAAAPRRRDLTQCVTHALMPGGRRIRLLKILLSSVCRNDCAYCAFRAARDVPRAAFAPEELAHCFHQMWQAGLVDGLFLSSGVGLDPVREMDRMLATVEILRQRLGFRGYVHLKILPGAEEAQVERAAALADRISTNLEAPTPQRLARLSRAKAFQEQLLRALEAASRQARAAARPKPVSVTSQFVVGAADETDWELLCTAHTLYRGLGLARIYYSPFRPIPDTPLEGHAPTPLLREHRLYQADSLLRLYGFGAEDLVFDAGGNLPLDRDPKLAWALAHPQHFPVEVNRAGRHLLLRVPG
ncbi:MAG: radical SAM protein, partial [Anaerolineae bacterium]|nr:radical SAM protein [Anaerolineae bacterium]